MDDESLIELINPEYRTTEFRHTLREWYVRTPGEPMLLRGFLREEFAERLDDMMRNLPNWGIHATAATGPNTTEDIAPEDWDDHPSAFARHLVAAPVEAALAPGAMSEVDTETLKTLLKFAVVGDTFRSWLSTGTEVDLARIMSLEIASYRKGDLIPLHQDLLPGRIMAVNLYMDRKYELGTGARLGYRNEDGDEIMTDPEFNSLSMIPIRQECWHWVEPFTGDGIGRYTVSMGQQDPLTSPK